MKKRIVFENAAFADFIEWISLDKKLHKKIVELLKDIERSPYEGLGKPEPLKYDLSGFWSRRIDMENRLIYKVTDEEIFILACKFHYEL
ncbi:Txe/YoeB family addiction module toxin [Laspinema olomoucense]|uniref:Endoribonuclease YoeB n=1 Tax=Laspinema olomoucense D3b TaxID=2953688 RepID=A0ABT2NDU1_9CYAN|nr:MULTISPECIES: Txe/YoeB family addiction module toxin [unclassified Laspinema]MCT7972463.1 Txe/YoeB family addiction module toxin [Laspinema sp. D3d]MCT7980626.1 Txe/YoeB family addiction module toxin [Laspinema sp. D3b]MCT7988631.1 Txe/YoeB family addiction module toxin [Laspinema sp. D3a]MCT7992797.1 Txe/YoeB family addiction module toxin [Laspinema sp. D3c]